MENVGRWKERERRKRNKGVKGWCGLWSRGLYSLRAGTLNDWVWGFDSSNLHGFGNHDFTSWHFAVTSHNIN